VTRVVDASVVVAALVDGGATGRWAEDELLGDHLAAPHLLPFEVSNILRRAALAGELSSEAATLAQAELHTLPMDLFPWWPLASRAWELRQNLTAYDAGYVALAELLEAELATLDLRLARAPGIGCPVRVPGR
jgi:predicted nucleic acid-binding protein